MATTVLSDSTRAIAAKKAFYRPELDALRFFAFLAVFLFHFNRPVAMFTQHGVPHAVAVAGTSLIEGGVFGVDLFFVLSAYLITELLLREKEVCGTLDVKGFYIRRVLRIWPLYFFLVGLALIPAFNPVQAFTWKHALAYIFLAGNWSIIAWGWPIPSIIGPLWTVSIEEQFYLVWPLTVRRLSRNQLMWAALVMLLISNAARIAMVMMHGGMNSVWCNTVCRLDPIAAGILVATTLRGGVPRFHPVVRGAMLIVGALSMALIANGWQIHEPQRLEWVPTLVGFPAVAAGCTVILLAVLGTPLPIPRPLLYLGKISYGLYVYQALGNHLSDKLIPVHTAFIQLALRPVSALAITLVLASVSYALLEKPFLHLKERFAHIHSRPV
jgi:peptidoglycan/LPS O-acetylase OafA/YrhL